MDKVFDEQTIATMFLKYTAICSELQIQAVSEAKNNPENLQASMAVAEHEAMIRTIAAMIELNNQALLSHFEHLGSLSKN